jgi:hypothetical protein
VSKQSDPFELTEKIIGRLGKDYMINGRLLGRHTDRPDTRAHAVRFSVSSIGWLSKPSRSGG